MREWEDEGMGGWGSERMREWEDGRVADVRVGG